MTNKVFKHWFWIALILGLILRLGVSLSRDPATIRTSGGDEFWYMVNGVGLFSPNPMGEAYGFPYAANAIGIAPLYLVVTGFVQQFFSLETSGQILWIIQSIVSIVSCYLSYRIAYLLTDDKRVGHITAIALAFSIAFIFEVGVVTTESLYIFFLLSSIWLYIELLIKRHENNNNLLPFFVGAVLGLATLTRAVGLLFPLGLVLHLVLVYGLRKWRQAILCISLLLLSYCVVIGTWTAYNWVNYQRFIVVSNQFMPSVWRGAVENDGSPRENDELLGEQTHGEQASEIISSDPISYAMRRANELLAAYLQPHGTIKFGQQSLKTMTAEWLQSGLSVEGLRKLISGEGFWIKLIIYVWHYASLIGGIIGMWLTRRNWRISLVLIGFIVYTSLIHLVTLALPRYIFPTYPIWWIFASVSIVALWDTLCRRGIV